MSILLAEPLGWIRRHLPRLRISLFVLNAPEGGGAAATINAARVHLLVNLDALQPQPQPSTTPPSNSPSHSLYSFNSHPKQVDLNGLYSRGARPRLLAARPAPLQAVHP